MSSAKRKTPLANPQIHMIITGAAGGIAAATLDKITAQYDGHLGLLDINTEGLNEMAQKYTRDGLKITPYSTDLRDHKATSDAIHSFGEEAGGIDILFANAGIMTAPGPFEVTSLDAIERSIDLNFGAVARCTHAAWPYLEKASGSVIVNASGAGLKPLASDVIYSSSKAAAIMFTKSSALRTKETGICFNAICPGVVDTPILNDSRTGEWRDEVHFFTQHFELIQPEEIADALLNLIVDTSANGEIIEIINRRKT